jgi:hypothetical protein
MLQGSPNPLLIHVMSIVSSLFQEFQQIHCPSHPSSRLHDSI